MFSVAGEKLTTRIRKLTFKAMLRQEAAYFDDSRHTVGVLCSRLSSDASSVQGVSRDSESGCESELRVGVQGMSWSSESGYRV